MLLLLNLELSLLDIKEKLLDANDLLLNIKDRLGYVNEFCLLDVKDWLGVFWLNSYRKVLFCGIKDSFILLKYIYKSKNLISILKEIINKYLLINLFMYFYIN